MLLDEIGTFLQTNSIGTLGTDLFEGFMPDTPDACVAILEYPGSPGEYTFGGATGAILEKPRIQVMVRNTSFPAAQTKMAAIYALLDAVTRQTLSGTQYHRIQALQPHFGMPRDINLRYIRACNFEATKDVS